MEVKFVYLVLFSLLLLVPDCFAADSKIEESEKTGLDPKSSVSLKESNTSRDKFDGSNLVSNSIIVDKEKKGGDQAIISKGGVEKNADKINSNSESESKGGTNEHKGSDVLRKDVNRKDEERERSSNGLESKGKSKDMRDKESVDSSTTTRKDGSWGEDCDPSNKCTDEENKLVACLRVPGNESPHLSLLIQNKQKGPLSVKISAPEFVHLEKTSVQLQEKEDKKVKVSIGDGGGKGGMIVLTAGSGRCSLDFRDLIGHNTDTSLKSSTYINTLTRAPIIAIIAFASLLTVASAWMCVSIRWKHLFSRSSKYQRLDMELPVSIAGKSVSDVNEGWDNSWDDNWDDEEAPQTPSMPVTPSLSSQGLASRRLNKDGWKD